MIQLQKYTWLIETIRRAGQISLEDLSDRWERNKDLNDGKPLSRATFNRWRDAVFSQFGIIISCRRSGGYLYYIENPEDITRDRLKKWMLDTFALGSLINANLALKDRISVSPVPSAYDRLPAILEAMEGNLAVEISYRPFNDGNCRTFTIEPYCVKLFENRWYLLANNPGYGKVRIYGLDRIEHLRITERTFRLPDGFSAEAFFYDYYGIVVADGMKSERIVIRAYENHGRYLQSLPLHHSQTVLEEAEDHTDFGLYLTPTYDFVMKLLQAGPMVEVISPGSLRETVKRWISDMYDLYTC